MRKFPLLLAIAIIVSLFALACEDSGSDSWPVVWPTPTPQVRDNLTLAENKTPYAATINIDNVTPSDSRATLFYYILENDTAKNYAGMAISLEPENPAKYVLMTEGPNGGSCDAVALGQKCDLTIIVASHSPETISPKLKIVSDQGTEYKSLTPIVSKYYMQPNVDSLDFGTLSAGTPAEKTFLVYNTYRYEHSISTPNYVEYLNFSQTRSLSAPEFSNGTTSASGFSIDNDPQEREFTLGEKTYSFGNCYPGSSTASLKNDGVHACYVKIKFDNAVPGTYSDELTIKFVNPGGAYKEARVRLAATVN